MHDIRGIAESDRYRVGAERSIRVDWLDAHLRDALNRAVAQACGF